MDATSERRAARRLSERIDAMLDTKKEREPDDLLGTARQLARLNELFGPPDPAFERRLTARIDTRLTERSRPQRKWRPRLAWSLAVALVLVAIGLFTSPGQAVLAELMAVFQLGRTEVRVEPEIATLSPAYTATAKIALSGLPEAKVAVEPRTLQAPVYLPDGYDLHRVGTSHFDELPSWTQPLFIDINYRRESDEVIWELSFRQYFVASGGPGTIKALSYPTEEFESVQEVFVGGKPAVFLSRLGAEQPAERVLHLVWEGENALLTLTTTELAPDELIRIAESVAPYP